MQEKQGLKSVFKELRVFSSSKRAEKEHREVRALGRGHPTTLQDASVQVPFDWVPSCLLYSVTLACGSRTAEHAKSEPDVVQALRRAQHKEDGQVTFSPLLCTCFTISDEILVERNKQYTHMS